MAFNNLYPIDREQRAEMRNALLIKCMVGGKADLTDFMFDYESNRRPPQTEDEIKRGLMRMAARYQ